MVLRDLSSTLCAPVGRGKAPMMLTPAECVDFAMNWQPAPHPTLRSMSEVERKMFCLLLYNAARHYQDELDICPEMPTWRLAAYMGRWVSLGIMALTHDGRRVTIELVRAVH